MRGIRIATRYARSLLLLSLEKNELEKSFADMSAVHSAISSSRDLRLFLANPVVKTDTKVKILVKIFGASTGVLVMSFMTLLVNKGRESLLAEVAESFVEQVKRHKKITSVELISAVPLAPDTRARVLEMATNMAKGEVDLKERVDADLIGGFVLRVGDQQVDASVSSEIRDLRRTFEKNPYVAEL
jgi:F-type H+-transporting ATPase subunit delta